jgi:hypothetical protein
MINFNLRFASSQKKSKKANLVKKTSQFNYLLLGTIALSSLGISFGNYLIDPYDIFRYHKFVDVKLIKPEKLSYDRLFKTIDIINIKPEIIILGSSRAKQGLDPNHKGFPDDTTIYNLGIDGSNTYEILRYLQHSYVNQPNLKKVILGIDHYMFNDFYELQDSFSEKRLGKTHITGTDLLNALFSQDALISSKNTIIENLGVSKDNKNLTYGDNGFFYHREPKDGKTSWRFTNTINQYFGFHKQYKLSENRFNDFKEIVEFCRKNHIELVVFISPSHATQWEALRVTDRWDSFETWKRKMVELTPVWDFSGYNSITTEPIKDVMTNYVDNSHYTPNIGNFVLNRILSSEPEQVPQDFGVLMTPENIDEHLAKIRRDREQWAKIQQNEVQLVEKLKRNFQQ